MNGYADPVWNTAIGPTLVARYDMTISAFLAYIVNDIFSTSRIVTLSWGSNCGTLGVICDWKGSANECTY